MENEMNRELIKLKYIMFENETNTCWLDASVSLVAHNRTFKKIVESSPDSEINKIISAYNEAINALNRPNCGTEQKLIMEAKEMLLELQTNTLDYLKKFLKFKSGEPDSAFCALLNLIYQDKSNIKEQLNVSWIWKKHCTNCDVNSKVITCQKPIITLSKVQHFHPECPSSVYTCSCKSEQEMKLIYKELPPCLIFHFEKGAGSGSNIPTSFLIKGREYKLTGIVILEKGSDFNINHFFTLIRDPINNYWLECNDLEKKFVSFSPAKPEFNLKDVYIYVFEAFDDLGKIVNDEALIDLDQEVENANVEVIDLDLSDENDSGNATSSKIRPGKLQKSVTDNGNSKLSQNFYSKVGSHMEGLSTNDKEYKTSVSMEKLETCSNGGLEESEKRSNSANNFKFPSKIHDSTSKTVDYKDSMEKFIEAIDFKAKIIKSNIADISSTNETDENSSSSESTETSSEDSSSSSMENEDSLNVNHQNASVFNFKIPSKYLLKKNDTEVESGNFTCQNPLNILKKSQVEATGNIDHKDASDCDRKGFSLHPSISYENSMQKSEKCNSENLKENNMTCSIDNKQLTIKANKLPNISFSDKHETKASSKDLNSPFKCAVESVEKLEFERSDYKDPTVPDALVKMTENLSTAFNSDDVAEKTAIIHEETSSEKKSMQNSEISSTISKAISDKREDELDKCDKEKFQMKMKEIDSREGEENKCDEKNFQMEMKQIDLKRKESKPVSSNERKERKKKIQMQEEKNGTEDDSNEEKENNNKKHFSSNQANGELNTNDQVVWSPEMNSNREEKRKFIHSVVENVMAGFFGQIYCSESADEDDD